MISVSDIKLSALGAAIKSSGRAFAEEHSQWILWLPVAVGIGVVLFLAVPTQPPLWLGAAILGPLLLLTAKLRHHEFWHAIGIIFILVALGFMAAQFRDYRIAHEVLSRGVGPLPIAGTITDIDHKEKTVRLTLVNVQPLEALRYVKSIPSRLRVSVRGGIPDDWQAGDRVKVLAKLMPLTQPTVPGGYDFAVLQYYKGLGATGFSFGKPELIEKSPPHEIDEFLERGRQSIRQKIHAAIPNKPAEAAIATAILTGEQNEIPQVAADQLRDSGLFHIISISGLHISYVAILIFFFVRRGLALSPTLALYWPLKKIAAAAALLGITAYTLFAGAPSPALRSCLMAAVVLLAIMVDRHAISLRMVAIAALVILLFEPEQIYSVSFQLSFVAVTGLISAFEFMHPHVVKLFMDQPAYIRWLRGPFELLASSLVATFATMPFVFYHFQSSQLLGVVANMASVPLTAILIMPFGCLGFLLAPFGLEGFAFEIMGWGISGMMWIAAKVAALPGAVWLMPALPPVALGFFTFGFLWLCIWTRPWRLWGLLIILLGFFTLPLQSQPDVMVAPGGKIAVLRRDDGSYALMGSGRESYYTESWARWFGLRTTEFIPEKNPPEFNCDDSRCLISRGGQTIALVRKPDGFFKSCEEGASIIMTVRQIKKFKGECEAAQTIRYWDSIDNGSYIFNFVNGGWSGVNVNDLRGNRPWVR
ncbi:MAG TPA: ComEC/Rec2 family competence protein [Alphaproteobacteria bacterium]|nr:ComEC/Rec2 family competence protein [Alphaproteobacteria bacterium]